MRDFCCTCSQPLLAQLGSAWLRESIPLIEVLRTRFAYGELQPSAQDRGFVSPRSKAACRIVARERQVYAFREQHDGPSASKPIENLLGSDSVRYQRPDRPRLGRRLFSDRDISLCSQFLHGQNVESLRPA